MEPDKFEKYIKSKMNEREISPSDGAWDKISGQINSSKKQGKPAYFWIGVAASLLVLISLSFFYFDSDNGVPKIESTTIVETQKSTSEDKMENRETSVDQIKEVPKALVVQEKTLKVLDGGNTETDFQKKDEEMENIVKENKSLANNTHKKGFLETDQKPNLIPLDVLDAKIAEVIAQVDAIEAKGEVSDAEVDSLLQKAQRDILREKLFNKDNTVDAIALLTEVEEELDQSFRDQIFETLKVGFLKVRTAVADRNN